MRTVLTAIVLTCAAAAPAGAQILQPPPRSTGGLFGGRQPADQDRTTQQLTLAVHVLGGYDDAISSEEGAPPGPQLNAYTGTAASVLRYWRGRAARFFEASARGYVNSYSDLDLAPLVGGDLDLRAMTGLSRRTQLTTYAGLHYQPRFLLASLADVGAPAQSSVTPDYSATYGVAEETWFTSSIGAGLQRTWNGRQNSSFDYGFSHLTPITSVGLESLGHTLALVHTWNLRRNGGLRFLYKHTDQRTLDEATEHRPFRADDVEIGLVVQKRWSATRRLEVGAGAGATRTRALTAVDGAHPLFHTPSAYGSLRVDVARTWAVTADLRRAVGVLEGLTPQPFITQGVSIGTGGAVAGRFQVAATADFSRGVARDGDIGSYEAVSGTAQGQWSASRWLGLVISYSYYNHLLRDVAAVPAGYPARYDRNTVRFGATIGLPLYGTF